MHDRTCNLRTDSAASHLIYSPFANTWSGKDNQLWKVINVAGNYYIQSKNGGVVDVQGGSLKAGANVQTYGWNGTNAQKWSFIQLNSTTGVTVTEGTYTIRSAANDEYVLDIDNASASNGANVQLFGGNNTAAQRFSVKSVGEGYYKIQCEATGKVLDVADGSMAAGANVQQFSWNGSAAQCWKFIDAGNGNYYIQSKLGTVLDIQNGTIAAKSNIQVFGLNKTNAQKWKLVATSNSNDNTELYSIMGNSSVTALQMSKYFTAKGGQYPYSGNSVAPTIKDFCQIYIDECKIEGVKAEVAFAQAMMETGFLRFGGDVKKEQYNFAGLGATGGGNPGNSFSSIRIGIRAQIQHLKAYASKENLKQECVDERYKYVTKGVAPYVEWLGQKENPTGAGWATAVNYGYNIVNLYITPLLNTSK